MPARVGPEVRRIAALPLLCTLACAGQAPAETASSEDTREAQPEPEAEPESKAEADPELAASGDEVITFDGLDAAAPPDATIRAAPQREPIERFQLFGEGGRGGPG